MIADVLEELKAQYNIRVGECAVITSRINTLQAEIDAAKAIQDYNTKLSLVLQKASEISRSNVKDHLEKVGTVALQYVFGKDISFEIDIQECRGRPEAEFYIVYTDGKDIIKVKPEDASGGGLIDVLSTALKYTFIQVMNEPKLQGPALFDEPGKMVSEVASHRMAELLKELTTSFGRQTIMCTHNDSYAARADNKIQIVMSGSKSKVVSQATFNVSQLSNDEVIKGDDLDAENNI